jgi:serine/threonine protein kinase
MDKSSSTISIAMEFCEGGSLDSVYREVKRLGGRTGEKVLGKVAEGVLHGLTYLNGKKIIHRGTQSPFTDPESEVADHSYRHKALEHPALPRWPSQAL